MAASDRYCSVILEDLLSSLEQKFNFKVITVDFTVMLLQMIRLSFSAKQSTITVDFTVMLLQMICLLFSAKQSTKLHSLIVLSVMFCSKSKT
jgi:hypothetical protein